MRIFSKELLLGSTVLLLACVAGAAADDGHYGREHNGEPVRRAISDLDRMRSIRYADGHERKHIENARRDLVRFEENRARGKFDRDRLDSAISHLSHLANSWQVQPREREVLYQDVQALRELRAYRGVNRYRW